MFNAKLTERLADAGYTEFTLTVREAKALQDAFGADTFSIKMDGFSIDQSGLGEEDETVWMKALDEEPYWEGTLGDIIIFRDCTHLSKLINHLVPPKNRVRGGDVLFSVGGFIDTSAKYNAETEYIETGHGNFTLEGEKIWSQR